MMTRRFTTILTSAYLSAMLASSVAPLGRSILAAPISPVGAQAAFDAAVGRLDAGWVTASAPAPAPVAQAVFINNPTKDPVMTPELMARIINYGRSIPENKTMAWQICAVYGRCDNSGPLAVKSIASDIKDHNIAIPADINSKDIYILFHESDKLSHSYLTDKNGTLRAAALYENGAWHLITNEQAAAGFKAEMTEFAKEAADLPPSTGTAVAATGNS